MGKQPCEVLKISKVFHTTLSLDFDNSTNMKPAISITAQTLFWSEIQYEQPYVFHKDSKVDTYSGTPEVYTSNVVQYKSATVQFHANLMRVFPDQSRGRQDDSNRQIRSRTLAEHSNGHTWEKHSLIFLIEIQNGSARRYPRRKESERLTKVTEVEIASFMGIVWVHDVHKVEYQTSGR